MPQGTSRKAYGEPDEENWVTANKSIFFFEQGGPTFSARKKE